MKISTMPEASPPLGDDELLIARAGVNRRIRFGDLVLAGGGYIASGTFDGATGIATRNDGSTFTPGNGGAGGVNGATYLVTVPGTHALDGITAWGLADLLVNRGATWSRVPFSSLLGSMAAQDADDIRITGGSATLHTGSIDMLNAGTVAIAGGTAALHEAGIGTLTAGTLAASTGTLDSLHAGTVTIAGGTGTLAALHAGTVTIAGGTATLDAGTITSLNVGTVAIAGGTAALDTLAMAGNTQMALDPRLTPLVDVTMDSTGAIAEALTADGVRYIARARLAQANADTLVATTGTVVSLTALDSLAIAGATQLTLDPRLAGLAQAVTDATGAVSEGVDSDGTRHIGTASLATLILNSHSVTPLGTRRPDLIEVTEDAAGNVADALGIDGTRYLLSLSLAGHAQTAIDPRLPDLVQVLADGSGAAADMLAADGTRWLSALSIAGASGMAATDPRLGDAALSVADAAGNIAELVTQDGTRRMARLIAQTATVATMAVTGAMTVASFAPDALTLAEATSGTIDVRLPDLREACKDAADAFTATLDSEGVARGRLEPRHIVEANRAAIKPQIILTQQPPDPAITATGADPSGTTYHLAVTLETAGYDWVRLIFLRKPGDPACTVRAAVAAPSSLASYIDPTDAAANPVPWVPATFNNAGLDIDLEAQSAGPLVLATTAAVASGAVLPFADTSAVEPGCVVSSPYLTPGSVVLAKTPTSVTLSAPPRYSATGSLPPGSPIAFAAMTQPLLAPEAGDILFNTTCSDWIPLSSRARSDGGRWPLLFVRAYVTGAPRPFVNTTSGPLGSAAWSGMAGDRVWSCYSASGDYVTSPAGFAPGADSHKYVVPAIQFYSRSKGCTILRPGDSVVVGVGSPGYCGAIQQAAYALSTPDYPITTISPWAWTTGFPAYYLPAAARRLVNLVKPRLLALGSWSRNNLINTANADYLQFTQADADDQWQWNMRLAQMVEAQGGNTLFYTAPPNTSMTTATDPIRIESVARARQAAAGGFLLLDAVALSAQGSVPDANLPLYAGDGFHPSHIAQQLYATALIATLRAALGK